MQWLRQLLAATVYVGPVLDSAGTAVTTAVLGDFRLVKNGTAATLTGATVTHDANGYYTIALTTTNTDTTGRLTIGVGNTAMSMGTHNYIVLLTSVFNALITNATNATGGLPTATAAITTLAGAISTYAGTAVASVTGAVGSVTGNVGGNVVGSVASVTGNVGGNVVGSVGSVTGAVGSVTGNVGGNVTGSVGSITTGGIAATSFAAGAINAAAIATDAIGAAEIAADAVTKIQNGLATPSNITSGTITTVTNLTNLPTIPANWLTAAGLASDAVTEIQSGLATSATQTSQGTTLNTIAGYLDTEVAAIKAKTDNLPVSPAATGDAMTLTTGERISIADATLGRSVATVESTAAEWSLASMILAAFESSIAGTTWTIKRTDGTTIHLTKTVTTNAAADPITGVS